jgi:hypothetical protein
MGMFISAQSLIAANDLVPDLPENKAWFVAEGDREAVWLGENGQACTIIVRKSRLFPGALFIETDVTGVEFASRKQATDDSEFHVVRLPLRANVSNELKLELQSGRPILKIGDAEIPALRASWIQVVTSPDEFIRVSLPNASHATIKFQFAGADKGASDASADVPTTKPATAKRIDGVELPVLNIKRAGSPQELVAASRALANGIEGPCRPCGGDGKITKDVQVGTRQEGLFLRPVYEKRTTPCTSCGGSGKIRAKNDVVLRLADNMLKSVARLNIESKLAPDALTQTYALMVERVIGDAQGWRLLNRNGRGVAAQQRVPREAGVIVRVSDTRRVQSDDGSSEWFVARVAGTQDWILLSDPVTAEVARGGTYSLAGGLAAGEVRLKDGRRYLVLQGGFVISPTVSNEWRWWWDE